MPAKWTIEDLIASTDTPRTRESLASDLRALGLEAGACVIVHSSLSSLGWVSGGAVAVVQALIDVVTESGAIVMPAHSYTYSDPATRESPKLSDEWVEAVRESLPAFDPGVVPTTKMGRIVEVFRAWPGTLRSRHPVTSFAAWGAQAEFVTKGQTYEWGQGENSPIARIYDLAGSVLLLGVGHDRNTSLHLAEFRISETPKRKRWYPVPDNGRSVWREFDTIDHMSDDWLLELGEAFEAAKPVTVGRVGSAEARFFPQREAVDFAKGWLKQKHVAR